MPELGYLTPTKDGKRNLPAGYFVDLATWQRINLLYTAKAKSDLRQIRYEAARPDLVDRMIEIVDHRYGHALATTVEKAKIVLTDQARDDASTSRCRARASAQHSPATAWRRRSEAPSNASPRRSGRRFRTPG